MPPQIQTELIKFTLFVYTESSELNSNNYFYFFTHIQMRELVEMADLVRHNDETIVKIREKLGEDYFLAVDNSKRSLQRRISIGKTEDLATVYVITVEGEEELELALATINSVVEMFLDD